MLQSGLSQARRLISGLRPPVLDELGVVSAIEYLIAEQQKRGRQGIKFRHDVSFDHLAPPLEDAVFRIVQEALNNACRHSRSKKIRVELAERDGHVCIEVRDWGVGFKPDEIKEGRFGVKGIRGTSPIDGRAVRRRNGARQGNANPRRITTCGDGPATTLTRSCPSKCRAVRRGQRFTEGVKRIEAPEHLAGVNVDPRQLFPGQSESWRTALPWRLSDSGNRIQHKWCVGGRSLRSGAGVLARTIGQRQVAVNHGRERYPRRVVPAEEWKSKLRNCTRSPRPVHFEP